jgi:carbonic anhydrase
MTERGTEQILERLKRGNARFAERARADETRCAELARGQQPLAVVLGCADSRVAPEIVFEADLGELFVVRVAGDVANTASIASIEFAVAQLGVRLVIVLAHESCGAVAAALEGADAGENLNHLLAHIAPALQVSGERDVNAVARRSARLNAERLTAQSSILREAVLRDGLQIVTAFFSFATGTVEFD